MNRASKLLNIIEGADGIPVVLMNEYAVSAQSPNQEAAWEFIKIMLSDEVQLNTKYEGKYQPVIKTVNDEYIKWVKTMFREPTREEVSFFNQERLAFFEQINRVYGSNGAPYVMDLIMEYTARYYKGEGDVHSMAKTLQDAVDIRTGR